MVAKARFDVSRRYRAIRKGNAAPGSARATRTPGVLHPHQIESVGVSGDPTGAPVARLEHLLRPFDRPLAGTDGHQDASDVAHHMVKESVTADVQHDQPTMLQQAHVMHGLDRRLGLALHRPERGEVMGADQYLGRLAHPPDIQRPMVPGDLLGQVRRADRIVVDGVAIAPGHGREARVEMRRHHPRPGHTDIRGQVGVGAHHPCFQRALHRGVEMHHLAAGMNGSVGTAGADHPDRLGGNLRQGALQRFLHGRHAGFLALPATIAEPLYSMPRAILETPAAADSAAAGGTTSFMRVASFPDQARRSSNSRASACWLSLPSARTSSRISRAPSLSPMSM